MGAHEAVFVTDTIGMTIEPVWDHTIEVSDELIGRLLELCVWEDDVASGSDLLGKASVQLISEADAAEEVEELDLPLRGSAKAAGWLRIRLCGLRLARATGPQGWQRVRRAIAE